MSETSDGLSESDSEMVQHYLETSTDEEICKMADLGDPAADHIFHTVWDAEKRKAVAARVDKQWEDQWG